MVEVLLNGKQVNRSPIIVECVEGRDYTSIGHPKLIIEDFGSSLGGLQVPISCAVNKQNGNIVVTVLENRILFFKSNGEFLQAFGSKGTENGQFRIPTGVAVDTEGNIIIADSMNHRVQVFDCDGTFMHSEGRLPLCCSGQGMQHHRF